MADEKGQTPIQARELIDNRTRVSSGKFNRITFRGARITAVRWSVTESEPEEEVELLADLERAKDGDKVSFRVFTGEDPKAEDTLITEAQGTATESGKLASVTWKVALGGSTPIPEIGDGSGARPASEREQKPVKDGKHGLPRFEASIGRGRKVSEPLKVERTIDFDFDAADSGSSLVGVEYLLLFAHGELRRGKLDDGGRLEEKGCPAGAFSISLMNNHFAHPVEWDA